MAPLKKIVVRNIGVLKSFDTPASPRLAKLTTIYARNGRGKTTLSTVLRSAGNGDAKPLLARRTLGGTDGGPEVTLLLDDGMTRFADGKWSPKSTPIEVFDATFIAENLHAGEAIDLEHDRGLFKIILGHAGVKLAKQQEFFNGVAKRAAAAMKAAEGALNDDLPGNMSREEFFAYRPEPSLDEAIEQSQKDLKGIQQAERLSRLKGLQKIEIPKLNPRLSEILASTIDTVQDSARGRLEQHFAKFDLGEKGEAWIKFGLEHIHDDSCPLCGKADVDERGNITLYGQIFGDAYQAHFSGIEAAIAELDVIIGSEARASYVRTTTANAEAVRDWSEFYTIGGVQLPDMNATMERLGTVHSKLKFVFDAKRQAPLVAIVDDDRAELALSEFNEVIKSLAAYNEAVTVTENAIAAKRAQSPVSEPQALMKLTNLMKLKQRGEPGVQTRVAAALRAKRADTRAKRIRTIVQGRLKTASDSAAAHYYERVNHYLGKFDATFQISKFSNSMAGNIGSIDYGLIVRGHAVSRGRGRDADAEVTFKTALSTGDKTTLAFAFFLAGIDRDSTLADKIIVFDDPMSSHDSHRQVRTIDYLYELCGRCAQIMVLSHDAHFLRGVAKRCAATDQVTYEIQYDGADRWSKAAVADLDELCQSEFTRELNILKEFYAEGTEDAAQVAPLVRRVLETHYRRTYTAYFGPTENLGPIIGLIRTEGENHPCWRDLRGLDMCNEATMADHHGEDASVAPGTPIDADNLRTIVGECLQLINAQRPHAVVHLAGELANSL